MNSGVKLSRSIQTCRLTQPLISCVGIEQNLIILNNILHFNHLQYNKI